MIAGSLASLRICFHEIVQTGLKLGLTLRVLEISQFALACGFRWHRSILTVQGDVFTLIFALSRVSEPPLD